MKILLIVFCLIWQHNVVAEEALIATVDNGIVPQTEHKDGYLPVRLIFEYGQKNYTVRLLVNAEKFNLYEQQMRQRHRPDYNQFQGLLIASLELADEGKKDLQPLAAALREIAPDKSKETLARFTLAFVQSLPYQYDALTTPYDEAWRTPLQTLVEQANDCEDSSILYVSLLSLLSIESGLVDLPGHILVAVAGDFGGDSLENNGQKFFYAETTSLGWKIGKAPDNAKNESKRFYPISALKNLKLQSSKFPIQKANFTEQNVKPTNMKARNALSIFFLTLTFLGIAYAAWYYHNTVKLKNETNGHDEFDDWDNWDDEG